MVVLLIVDMQVGMFAGGPPRHDAEGVIERIGRLAAAIAESGGAVVFVQHDGPEGDALAPGSPGWELLPELRLAAAGDVVRKTTCDAFYRTGLHDLLRELGAEELIICGCATDFCVDATLRAAVSLDYAVTVAADAHTMADRPHLDAAAGVRHYNWLWGNLITPRPVRVLPSARIIDSISNG